MVRALFAVASALQPAVIFMDEIDSVLSARKAEGAAVVYLELPQYAFVSKPLATERVEQARQLQNSE